MQHAFAWRRAMFASLALIPALALTAAPARAADNDVDVQMLAVHYHDLDLTTAKGRARLEARLESAAATVCHQPRGDRPWHGDAEGMACYNTALTHAHTALAAAQDLREMAKR